MAIKYMNISSQSSIINGIMIYEFSESINTPGDGDTWMLPDGAGKMNVALITYFATLAQGNVEISNSPRDQIKAGNARWQAWDKGVRNNTDDALVSSPFNAIKQHNDSGLTILEVTIQ